MTATTTQELDLKVSMVLLCIVHRLLDAQRLLEEWEVEHITGLSQETLRRTRLRWEKGEAGGIQFIRFGGGDIRYKREHVEAFIAAW